MHDEHRAGALRHRDLAAHDGEIRLARIDSRGCRRRAVGAQHANLGYVQAFVQLLDGLGEGDVGRVARSEAQHPELIGEAEGQSRHDGDRQSDRDQRRKRRENEDGPFQRPVTQHGRGS